jgi:hypothetical protein
MRDGPRTTGQVLAQGGTLGPTIAMQAIIFSSKTVWNYRRRGAAGCPFAEPARDRAKHTL